MSWQLFDTTLKDRPAQVLFEDRFATEAPIGELPTLVLFSVHARLDPQGGYWNPEESDTLDKIENDLIGYAGQFGNGWAVYVRRLARDGLRVYYFYAGEGADLGRMLPAMQAAHPDYRFEHAATADAQWQSYRRWAGEAADRA